MKKQIRLYVYWAKNLVNILWWKVLFLFGVKRSTLHIPSGMYCYTPDIEKNKVIKDWRTYYIKPCKYYKTLGHTYMVL